MRQDKKPNLLLAEQQEALFSNLTNTEAGKLIKALMAYRWHGIEPELSDKLSGIFLALKSYADFDLQKYNEKCETNRKSVQEYHDRRRAEAENNGVRS